MRAIVVLFVAATPLAVEANYRCVGKDGKKYYGQAVPPQCVGVTVEQLNAEGRVVRRIEPPAAAAEPASLSPAEQTKRRAEQAAARRDQALLATYTNEGEIEEARQRALRAAKSVDAGAINARYDADLRRYRELQQLRRDAPLRREKGVTVVTPAPPRGQRERDAEQARRVAEQEAEALRRLQAERGQQPSSGVSRIDPVAPSELSPPRQDDGPTSIERDEPIRFQGQRPSPGAR